MLIGFKISKKEKKEVKNLVREYEDWFMEGLETVGIAKYILHQIKLKMTDPIYTPQHWQGKLMNNVMNEEIARITKMRVIWRL